MSESSAAAPQPLDFGVRPWNRATEEAFIFETWLKGTKHNTHEARKIRDSVFYPGRHKIIELVLDRGAKVLIAHPADDPDTILGCLVYENAALDRPVLHWLFVKLPWRRFGVATRLLLAAVNDPNSCDYSCRTVWHLSIPAGRSVNRSDRSSIRDARANAVRDAHAAGTAGGDTDDLVRRWPGLRYNPDALYLGV